MPGAVEAVASMLVLAATLGVVAAVAARRRPVPSAPGRPLEQVAADVRRISARFHQEGMRFAQYEGRRQSYDQVLAEAADVLEVAHLLRVLPPGAERDTERERLEGLLTDWGLLRRRAY